MAKPRHVDGVDPGDRLRPNARRVLAVRIDEAWSFAPEVVHPGNVTALHDMRIAFKRLRYLLEIFQPAFQGDLGPYIDTVKDLQDVLGTIHDCDVQVPMLHDHLERLAERDADNARTLLRDSGGQPVVRGARQRGEFERFRERLERTSTVSERPGIEALLSRRTQERDVQYVRFLMLWRDLEERRFRERLERALGVAPRRGSRRSKSRRRGT